MDQKKAGKEKKKSQFSPLSQVKFCPSYMRAENLVKVWQRAHVHAHMRASANACISNMGYF